MTLEHINELMEASDVSSANKALDEGWTFISVVSKEDNAIYVLGRHKETPKEAAIRRVKAENAAAKAEAAKKIW